MNKRLTGEKKAKLYNMWHEEREKPQIYKRFKNLLENIIYKYITTNFITWKSIIKLNGSDKNYNIWLGQ